MDRRTQIEIDGVAYEGGYDIDGSMLNVRYRMREKSAHLGGEPPEIVARKILRELVVLSQDKEHSAKQHTSSV